MQHNQHRVIRFVLAAPATLLLSGLLLSGCSVLPGQGTTTVSGSAGPAGAGQSTTPVATTSSGVTDAVEPTSPAATNPTTAHSSSGGTSSGASKGCPAGGAAVPAGANKAGTGDLDGDGKPDTLWLADPGDRRVIGVTTASGARFSTSFTSASPVSASAVASRLGDGSTVILLNTDRSVALYTVTGCKIVPSRNLQGQQYTFDEGFTGFGSGVGCPVIGSTGRHLVGYQAKGNGSGSSYTVTRTPIVLRERATQASNGSTTTLGTKLPATSAIVKTAQSVTCGPNAPVAEPQS